eukprot:scaffold127676_cov19-Tisochrysis_lutea.AAC.1
MTHDTSRFITGHRRPPVQLLFTSLESVTDIVTLERCHARPPVQLVRSLLSFTGVVRPIPSCGAPPQAMPGPLFNFSAYLGALFASKFGYPLVLGSAVAWLGLFGPGVALMFAAMPYWTHVRRFPLYRYALPDLANLMSGKRLKALTALLSKYNNLYVLEQHVHFPHACTSCQALKKKGRWLSLCPAG